MVAKSVADAVELMNILMRVDRGKDFVPSRKFFWLGRASDIYSAWRWRLHQGAGGKATLSVDSVTMLVLGPAWFKLKTGTSCANGHF